MKRFVIAAALTAGLGLPLAAQAGEGSGGDRMPAGGAHMSSYVHHPYHDPRSLYAQRRGTGQILGAPMYRDGPAIALDRRGPVNPNWAIGGTARPRR